MAQLTVRNIPEDLVKALRIRAARHGRSAEAEHRVILAEALAGEAGDFWASADRARRRTRASQTDSGVLQREMRDER